MTPIGKDITKRNKIACGSGELHAICFLCPHVCYVFIMPLFIPFLQHSCDATKFATRCHKNRRFETISHKDTIYLDFFVILSQK